MTPDETGGPDYQVGHCGRRCGGRVVWAYAPWSGRTGESLFASLQGDSTWYR
jgi:hypothetical protein